MKFSYYPGCTLKTKGKDLDRYGRLSAQALGITLEELADWQCCGAVYPMAKDEIATKLSAVRALVSTRDQGQELVTLCSACHNVIKQVNNDMKTDADIVLRVNNYLKPEAPIFADGGALFTFDKLKRCMSLREMKDDYGILPMPMYNEEQAKYYGPVSNYHDSMFAVISTNIDNRETIGAALELMGHYSYYNIYRDFYEVLIQNRGTRDAESKEMLAIIFANRAYDMGLIYDPHSLMDKVLRITKTGEDGVVSQWAGLGTLRDNTIEQLNALVEKYN